MISHSGCYHLYGSDSRHVEFIRTPGDTITPVLHLGRGTKSVRTIFLYKNKMKLIICHFAETGIE